VKYFIVSFFYLSCLCAMENPTTEYFFHHGHQYLVFNKTQIIHDPDCPCQHYIKWMSYNEKNQTYKIKVSPASIPED